MKFLHTCTICECTFVLYMKHNINHHVATVHEEKKHSIVKCVTTNLFKIVTWKKNVSWFHDGNKPFKCDISDYRSSRKSDLNKHVASVHEVNKPFKYDICDYSCSQKSHSNRNVESVHEGKNVEMWQLWLQTLSKKSHD